MMRKGKNVLPFLSIGLLATSFPAILVRLADAGFVAISFYRNFLASIFIFPIALYNLKHFTNRKGIILKMFLTAFFLALHFLSWNASVKFTSVASSLVIVATQPIWSAILGVIFLKEKISFRGFLAIFISLLGIVGIAVIDYGGLSNTILGDIFALFAAIFASLYLVMGRSVRDKIPLSVWLFNIYFISSMIILFTAIGFRVKMGGFSLKTYLMFFLMALIPSFIGHTLLNYSVRYIEAYKVQLGIILEPIVSSILAYFVFFEKPSLFFYPFALLSFIGVILGISENSNQTDSVEYGQLDSK